jgi:hypothetical protein
MPIDRSKIKWDDEPINASKIQWDGGQAEPGFEQAGVGAIGRLGEMAVKYFGEPAEKLMSKTAPTAFVSRTLGNVPSDVTNIASGFTAPALAATGSALYNQPLGTLAGMGGAALEGAGQFLADPLGTFERAPVSTMFGLQAAQALRAPTRLATNVLAERAYPLARRAISPTNRMLTDVFGTPQIETALQGATPGMTVPQALADVNAPKAQAVARQAMSVVPEETRSAQLAQEQARRQALTGISGTPEDLTAAQELRSETAKQNYGRAFKQVMQATPEMTDIMGRPSMETAFSRAAQLAKERGKTFQIGKTTPETITESKILDEFGRPVQKITPAEIAKYPVQSLHYVKMALDDMVRDPETFGIGASEVGAIQDTRKAFISGLEKNPAYAKARSEYAAQSEPINKMQVLQALRKTVIEPVTEGATRAGMFARAIEEAPRTIKKATGQQFFTKLEDVLSPEDMDVVNSVRDEFRRTKLADEQATLGAKAAPEVEELASAKVTSALNIPFLNRAWTIANTVVKRSLGKIDEKLATEIGLMMQDPAELNRAIAKAKRYEKDTAKTVGKLREKRQKMVGQLPKQALYGSVSFQNAMSPQNQNAMAR